MFWPLTVALVVGTAPGLVLGVYLRLRYLPDPRAFKAFVGAVLLYLGVSLVRQVFAGLRGRAVPGREGDMPRISRGRFGARYVTCVFDDREYRLSTPILVALAFLVGIVSGTYGIGGGSLFASLFVVVFRLPVYIIAASTLACNFVGSVVGVLA